MAQIVKYKGHFYQRIDADTQGVTKALVEYENYLKEAEKEASNALKDIDKCKLAMSKGDLKEVLNIVRQIKDEKLYGMENAIERRVKLVNDIQKRGGFGSF